jgi:hypothetical protein
MFFLMRKVVERKKSIAMVVLIVSLPFVETYFDGSLEIF